MVFARRLGKWHLGDLWDKKLPGMSAEKWSVSDPGKHGFDDWMTTQAEASNSMTNCGCFHKNHSHPGRKPNGGYSDLVPLGDHCVVGSGFESDWCYPCTDYFYPNASDPRGVSALSETVKVPGDDSTFLIDRFELFLAKQISAANPWLAHICFHAIHEPHPAMPEFWDMYATPGTNRGDPNYRDPDYLGALTMWDVQIGRLMSMLKEKGVADSTAIFYTADNVPLPLPPPPLPLAPRSPGFLLRDPVRLRHRGVACTRRARTRASSVPTSTTAPATCGSARRPRGRVGSECPA